MLRVFVALGKQMPKNKKMIEDTAEVSRLLAKYNCTLVQGGARVGLMGIVAEEFQKYSEEVVMIVPEVHKADLEGTKSKEHYIVEGEADRLKITIKTCDLMVVLPGGTGTMAELAYYNETRKSGEHGAKLVMVNTNGFYNGLFKFVKHQVKNGFMKKEHFNYEVISDAKQLEPILKQLIKQKQEKLQQEEIKFAKEQVVKEAKKVVKIKPALNEEKPKNSKAKKSAPKTESTKKSKLAKSVKPVAKQEKPIATKTPTKKAPTTKVEKNTKKATVTTKKAEVKPATAKKSRNKTNYKKVNN